MHTDEIAMRGRGGNHKPMRMKCRRRDRLTAIAQEARVGFPLRDRPSVVDIEDLDLVALGADCEDGRVLVHAERFEVIARGLDGLNAAVHANVPELDFAIAAPGDKLALSAALEVHVGDPLFVLFPNLDHGSGRLLALVIDAHGAVAEAGDEDVAFDLIRCE